MRRGIENVLSFFFFSFIVVLVVSTLWHLERFLQCTKYITLKNCVVSLKSIQMNLLSQSISAYRQGILGCLPKLKFKLFGGSGCLDFCINFWFYFNQVLFFTAVISQFYFITCWDFSRYFQRLEKYLFSQCKKQTPTNCQNFEEHCLSLHAIFFAFQRPMSPHLPRRNFCRNCLHFFSVPFSTHFF
jgi:hypothetical protein